MRGVRDGDVRPSARGCVAVRAVGYTLGDTPTLADRRLRLLREECYSWNAMKAREGLSELIFLVEEAPEGGFTARASRDADLHRGRGLSRVHDRVGDAVISRKVSSQRLSAFTSCVRKSSPREASAGRLRR